ncbi:MAG: hypothetical protein ACLPLZ_04545 [Terracidiphilus sp.]|jgi:hypothetical protein
MKPNLNLETDHDADELTSRILAAEEELIPSSGFLAATMERVRDEAACPEPIPFPWLRALPGIVLAVAVLGWCGFELARAVLANVREASITQVHLPAVNAHALEPAGWVAAALAVSMLSWLFARRLAGRSGLL